MVLVVEDDEPVARAIRRTVERYLPTREVRGVREALRLLEETNTCVRAAIIDVGLLDGDGLELARAVHALRPMAHILVITGRHEPELANDAQRIGAHFAYKPISTSDLRAFMRRAVANAPDTRVSRALTDLSLAWQLSDRESELVRDTLAGVDRGELASLHGVAESTIKTQIRAILTKTGLCSLEAVARRVLQAALESA